jgi:hypothetical protein
MTFRSPLPKGQGLSKEGNPLASQTYEFTNTYDTVTTVGPPTEEDPSVLRVNITGEIAEGEEAPFGLTHFESNTFGQMTSSTTSDDGTLESAEFTFDADPTAFGLSEDLEQPYSDRYFGNETENELFGNASDSAEFDFVEGTVEGSGETTIIGGDGIFEDATGSITFEQQDELPPVEDTSDPLASLTEPFEGQATLTFSVETPGILSTGSSFTNEDLNVSDYLSFAG